MDPQVVPDSGPAADSTAVVDKLLLQRLGREVRSGAFARPDAVTDALAHCSKQVQLWNIERRELEVGHVKRERAAGWEWTAPAGEAAKSAFAMVVDDGTRAMRAFVGASVMAKKGFLGFRALKRVAVRKPYK